MAASFSSSSSSSFSFSSSSSSSSLSHAKIHHVFPSFHGPDVRRGFLSHLHHVCATKEIPMFKDQEIERGNTIGSELVQAIKEARASIVVLSKNYASSIWCLDELLEILKCKEASGQIVLPIFYDVDPSDVRKQKGDFGIAFLKTCEGETEEQKRSWIEALTCVATIAGEHSRNWTDESAMVEKISTDVFNKLTVEERKKRFRALDVDHNGFITAPELRYVLTKDGDQVIDEELCDFIRAADVNGDGRISYNEFVKMIDKTTDEAAKDKLATDMSNRLKELKKEFMALDVDHNGFITAPELRYVMTKDGDKVVTDEEVYDLIRAADVDGDGRISYDEYVKLIMMAETTDEAAKDKLATDVSNILKVEELKKEFMALDVDHNGFITASELRYVLTKDGDQVIDEEVCDFIRAADVDGDGRISYDEFVKMIDKKIDEESLMVKNFATDVTLSTEEKKEMMELFMALDVDKNGFITAAEFQYVMNKRGEKVTDGEACNFIRTFDVDGDGRVSYDEFVKMMMAEKTKAARVEKFATDVSNKVNRFVKFMIKFLT